MFDSTTIGRIRLASVAPAQEIVVSARTKPLYEGTSGGEVMRFRVARCCVLDVRQEAPDPLLSRFSTRTGDWITGQIPWPMMDRLYMQLLSHCDMEEVG